MKILFGVQGTGNGHISRARAMARAFSVYPEISVQWLFSGREPEAYFDMEEFGDYLCYRGLTFYTSKGKVQNLKTLFKNNPIKFLQDKNHLDLSPYDLVISDYEPITTWAAKKSTVPSLGMGHQYAFNYPVPLAGDNLVTRLIMKNFAPMKRSLGLHWHHFNQPILPPIVDLGDHALAEPVKGKVLFYLPFEGSQKLLALLQGIHGFEFYVYSPDLTDADNGFIHTRKPSKNGFKQDLASAERVVCNSGFELISEALQLGKTILAKPLTGQMEQHSNALALQQLGFADTLESLDQAAIQSWLAKPLNSKGILYPDVSAAIAKWIVEGARQALGELSAELWSATKGIDAA